MAGQAPEGPPAYTPGQAQAGSTGLGVIGGITIPLLTIPLLLVGLLIATIFDRELLSAVLSRQVHRWERYAQTPGKAMMWNSGIALGTGLIAASIAGVGMVKLFFKRAHPGVLIAVGSGMMLLVGVLLWAWSTRNSPGARGSAAWYFFVGWIGSLLGLWVASWETKEGARKQTLEEAEWARKREAEVSALMATAYPSRAPLGSDPAGETATGYGQAASAYPPDTGQSAPITDPHRPQWPPTA